MQKSHADQVTARTNGSSDAPGAPEPPAAPLPLPAIPRGGGRVIIDKQGDRTVITTAALPPDILVMARRAEETAFGLMGLLAAIIILGPFARMIARRMERRPELEAANNNNLALHQQLQQLQRSVDDMSVEIERVGEAQRFQSKLLYERKT